MRGVSAPVQPTSAASGTWAGEAGEGQPQPPLDLPGAREGITTDLERTIRGAGMAAVLVTHDRTEALRLSDRMVVIQAGRIIQAASPGEVMNNPANEFIAGCVGMDTILEGVVERSVARHLVVAVGAARLGFPMVSQVTPESFSALRLREGSEVFASAKTTAVWVIQQGARAAALVPERAGM